MVGHCGAGTTQRVATRYHHHQHHGPIAVGAPRVTRVRATAGQALAGREPRPGQAGRDHDLAVVTTARGTEQHAAEHRGARAAAPRYFPVTATLPGPALPGSATLAVPPLPAAANTAQFAYEIIFFTIVHGFALLALGTAGSMWGAPPAARSYAKLREARHAAMHPFVGTGNRVRPRAERRRRHVLQ